MPLNFGYTPRSGFYWNRSQQGRRDITKEVSLYGAAGKSMANFQKGLKKRKRYGKRRPKSRAPVRRRTALRVSRLARRLSKVEKNVDSLDSLLDYRDADETFISSSSGQSTNGYVSGSLTHVNSCLAQAKMYDATTNAFLVKDLASGTYNREIKLRHRITRYLRNNTSVNIFVDAYVYKVVDDTSVGAAAQINSGLADATNSSISNPFMRAEDSPHIGASWKRVKKFTKMVMPGRQISVSWGTKWFDHSPDYAQTQTDLYTRENHCLEILFVMRGSIEHQPLTPFEVGIGQHGCDIITVRDMYMKYNSGGPAIKYVYLLDSTDQDSGKVHAEQPDVATGQTYAI